ncbi:DUF6907 domain-containing protein [Streptomyces sp. NPDC057253]|uniref:DUF6907 domain-containing protein n=1 Tax=Streptomyces sp. NPDC057253 TaxID=3346069 RepID=UPI003640D96B
MTTVQPGTTASTATLHPTAQRTPTTPSPWSFTSSETGQSLKVTCLPGCTINHDNDRETPTHPVDVFCWTQGNRDAVTLPVDTTGTPEDFRILTAFIEVQPFAAELARRLPFAVVEVLDEHYISPLDPDGLETVINTLAGRLDNLRRVHAELVQRRAEYVDRTAVTA